MAAPVLDIIQKRLEQLAAHGYVEMRKGQWELTEKGLCCLIACAEPPMPEPMDAYKSSCSELSRGTRFPSKFLYSAPPTDIRAPLSSATSGV